MTPGPPTPCPQAAPRAHVFFPLRLSLADDVADGTPGKDKDGGQVWERGSGDSVPSGSNVVGGVWEHSRMFQMGWEAKYEAVRSDVFAS